MPTPFRGLRSRTPGELGGGSRVDSGRELTYLLVSYYQQSLLTGVQLVMARVLTPSKRRGKPRWQRRKDARPEEILAAALDVFVERGFARARLEEVARRAGVTKGTIYLYFKSKEALFKAVVRGTIVPVIAQGEALAQSFTGSARDLVEQLVRSYWTLVGETRLAGIPKLMMAEAATFPALTKFY